VGGSGFLNEFLGDHFSLYYAPPPADVHPCLNSDGVEQSGIRPPSWDLVDVLPPNIGEPGLASHSALKLVPDEMSQPEGHSHWT
jgi:hypothetical protein